MEVVVTAGAIIRAKLQQGSCAPEVLKNSRLFKAFSFNNSSPIQGPSSSQSFYSIPSYWYSRKDTISGTRAWHLLIKGYKQFYQLYSNYGRKFAQSPSLVETFSIDKFQTSQGLPLFFQNNPRTCSVFLNSRTWSHGRRRNPVEMKWCQLELRRHCTAPVRSPPALVFLHAGCPSCYQPTVSKHSLQLFTSAQKTTEIL